MSSSKLKQGKFFREVNEKEKKKKKNYRKKIGKKVNNYFQKYYSCWLTKIHILFTFPTLTERKLMKKKNNGKNITRVYIGQNYEE